MSPKELEQQEAERKKREQEGKRKHRKSPKLPNKNGKKNRNAHGDSDANAKKSGLHYDSSLFSVLLVAIMSLCGNHKHIHDLFIDFVNKPVFLVHFP